MAAAALNSPNIVSQICETNFKHPTRFKWTRVKYFKNKFIFVWILLKLVLSLLYKIL